MAVITIPWTTGSGNIYLTLDGTEGARQIRVSSDANPLFTARSQAITFVTATGGKTATLRVTQEALGGSFDNSFDLSFTVNT